MRKSVCVLAMLCAIVGYGAIFADAVAKEYVVQTVTGKVEREVSPGNWEAVKAGMKLAPSAVIHTGLNSSLVVRQGDSVLTIKAMQKGPLDKLASGVAAKGSGIKIGAKAKKSDAATDDGPERTNVSTASTRASDATQDIDWAE